MAKGHERQTICFPHLGTPDVLQYGDIGFHDELSRLYQAAESDALEGLIKLKTSLQILSTEEFWAALTEGISKLLGAEMSFVFKRVLTDDHNAAVEMPPIGEVGSCLMAAAFHYQSRNGSKQLIRDSKFHAYGCPCAYMRHDKVFLIPEKLNEFITNNPNSLPAPAEAYIAIPLFEAGKCFAHFGAMFSKEATMQRRLSWAFIEMLLHSLEDIVLQRLIEGANFVCSSSERTRVMPHDAISNTHSLRPYAGSLSHELRTPMQGIVGMLDVMYATVQEAERTHTDPQSRKTFEDLRDNIEIVQDSSRRAVEAADNVVHAADMDMSIPDAPPYLLMDDPESASPFSRHSTDKRPEIFVAGSNLPLPRKRRREDTFSRQSSNASGSNKIQRIDNVASLWSRASEASQEVREGLQEAEEIHAHAQPGAATADISTVEHVELFASSLSAVNRIIAPGIRHTNMREVFRYVISEGLKMGGRPDSALAQENTYGETIEVRSRGSDGTSKTKWIDWSVDPNLPATMFIDEKDLSKLISCVILNAIKFTDEDGGRVSAHAKMSSRGRYVAIKIADNGPGMPAAFLPRLFKAFARENASRTRPSDGLGLGLMVAKGIARKLGGDLMCIRAETEGPNRGSEFEIRVPMMAGETISRPSSPFGSPRPDRPTLAPLDITRSPPWPPLDSPRSPSKLSHALHELASEAALRRANSPSTPPSPKSHARSYLAAAEAPVAVTSSPPTPPPVETQPTARPRFRKSVSNPEIDRDLANKYPLTFLVAEDNKINRKLLVSMLGKFGYRAVHEAHDGAEAVRQMKTKRERGEDIDVVLMDLWMPLMDGYEAAEKILSEPDDATDVMKKPTVLAVTADVTDGAQERAARVGMKGFMTKPYKINDLQKLIKEYCAQRESTPIEASA